MTVLTTAVDDGVLTITLDRPDVLNAVNDELKEELVATLAEYKRDDSIRCLVLEGNGNAFCSGGDLNQMQDRFESGVTGDEYEVSMRTGGVVLAGILYEFPPPTIAKVHGTASGMGLSLMLACDLAVAAEDTTFGATFRNVGFGPDAGCSYLLTHLLGPRRAKELLFTAEYVDAERAETLGLVNDVVDKDKLDEAVADLAGDVADAPPKALTAAKRLVNASLDSDFATMLRAEADEQSRLFETKAHRSLVEEFF